MIRTIGYRSEYLQGVIKLFQTIYGEDYPYAERCTRLLSYGWNSVEDLKKIKYLHGMVILDDEKVVGYFGGFYKILKCNGNEYIYCNMSKWLLLSPYRKYFIKITNDFLKTGDVFSDYSASPSVLKVLINLFHFEYIDKESLRFFPVLYEGKSNIEIKEMNSDSLPGELRICYDDHKNYNIECVRISTLDIECYIFYSVMYSDRYHSKYVRVYKVTNPSFVAMNAHEIVWYLQKKCFENITDKKSMGQELFSRIQNKELFLLECESRFFGEGVEINHPLYFGKPEHHLMLNKTGKNIEIPDLLYSEYISQTREQTFAEHIFDVKDFKG